MSTNLFGQYYTNKASRGKYQTYNYVCSTADDGTNNSVIFDDGNVELVDANGNVISKLDLSGIAANPITDYRNGSFTLGQKEVRLLEGLEFGKSYKKMYFMIPDEVFEIYGDFWEEYCNVNFNFLFNFELDLREFNIKTVYKEESKSIIERIQYLLNLIGLEEKVEVGVESVTESDGMTHTYFTFTSLVLGYDFLIQDFKLHTMDFAFYIDEDTGERVVVYMSDVIPEKNPEMLIYGLKAVENEKNLYTVNYSSFVSSKMRGSEDNVVFSNGEVFRGENGSLSNFGHYDNMDYPNDELSADHFYLGETINIDDEPSEPDKEPLPDDGSDDEKEPLPDDGSDDGSDGDGNDSEDDKPEEPEWEIITTPDGEVIYVRTGKCYDLYNEQRLEIYPFKYPNGASRVWFLVPEFPEGEEQTASLKINHVVDCVPYFRPVATRAEVPDDTDLEDCADYMKCADLLYQKELVRVFAGERSEKERHSLYYFNEFFAQEFKFCDDENGCISSVKHCEDVQSENPCNCLFGNEMPHIGMYRYLDYVQMHYLWLNVGQFYGLITNADNADDNTKNLANSLFIYNPNDYPVKVNYFIGY